MHFINDKNHKSIYNKFAFLDKKKYNYNMKSGIYFFKNKINNKYYIGQSINIERRFNQHIHSNNDCYFHKALKKYGIDNFEFGILEYCGDNELNDKEKYYINLFKSNNSLYGYNLTDGGGQCKHIYLYNDSIEKYKYYDLNKKQFGLIDKKEIIEKYKLDDEKINKCYYYTNKILNYKNLDKILDNNYLLQTYDIDYIIGLINCFNFLDVIIFNIQFENQLLKIIKLLNNYSEDIKLLYNKKLHYFQIERLCFYSFNNKNIFNGLKTFFNYIRTGKLENENN